MPYPEQLVKPMRDELARVGVTELRDAAAVEDVFSNAGEKTHLLVINSVCGCAAANARPAVILSMQSEVLPDEFVTVFAGQDMEATAQARKYLAGIPPSSPFIALFKDCDPVFVLERRHIEGRSASAIAMDLVKAYQSFCSTETSGASETVGLPKESAAENDPLPPTFRSIL